MSITVTQALNTNDRGNVESLVHRHATVRNIVNNAELTPSMVYRRLNTFGITGGMPSNPEVKVTDLIHDKEYMTEQLSILGRSFREVARGLGLAPETVSIAASSLGIQSEHARAFHRVDAYADAVRTPTYNWHIPPGAAQIMRDTISLRYFMVKQDKRYKGGETRVYLFKSVNRKGEVILSKEPPRIYSQISPYSQYTKAGTP